MPKLRKTSDRSKSRASEEYRQCLEARHGVHVPEREVEAFEAVFCVALKRPSHAEAMLTAVRAGAAEGQRRNRAAAAGAGGDGQ